MRVHDPDTNAAKRLSTARCGPAVFDGIARQALHGLPLLLSFHLIIMSAHKIVAEAALVEIRSCGRTDLHQLCRNHYFRSVVAAGSALVGCEWGERTR